MKRFDSQFITGTAGEILAAYVRVKYNSAGRVIAAGLEKAVGVTTAAAAAIGDTVPIKLLSGTGSTIMLSGIAIAIGDQVYPAAAGKISTVTGAVAEIPEVPAVPGVPGVAASGVTGVEGNNNGLTHTAKVADINGNEICVQLIDPAGNNQALAVTIEGQNVKVSLATGEAGAITSTAAEVLAAINAAADCDVTTSHTGESTGAAAVVAETVNLSGGVDAVPEVVAVPAVPAVAGMDAVGVAVTAASDAAEPVEVVNY